LKGKKKGKKRAWKRSIRSNKTVEQKTMVLRKNIYHLMHVATLDSSYQRRTHVTVHSLKEPCMPLDRTF